MSYSVGDTIRICPFPNHVISEDDWTNVTVAEIISGDRPYYVLADSSGETRGMWGDEMEMAQLGMLAWYYDHNPRNKS